MDLIEKIMNDVEKEFSVDISEYYGYNELSMLYYSWNYDIITYIEDKYNVDVPYEFKIDDGFQIVVMTIEEDKTEIMEDIERISNKLIEEIEMKLKNVEDEKLNYEIRKRISNRILYKG